MKKPSLRSINVLWASLLAIAGLVVPISTAHAATWAYKYSVGGTSCPSSGAYPIAGTIWFAAYNSSAGACFSNGTVSSSSDSDLRNDTWANQAPMAPGINHVGQTISTGTTVTIWQGIGCSGPKQTITTSFTPSVNYYSFKKNSSTNGC